MTTSIQNASRQSYRRAAKTNPRYAHVYFGARLRFDLTLAEATLCDIVVVLSRKTGWCFASRAYLATILGMSERQVRRMITELSTKSLLERHSSDQRQVRATMLWITECQADNQAGP